MNTWNYKPGTAEPQEFDIGIKTNRTGEVVPLLKFSSLEAIDFINHGFSTRLGGVSEGIFSTMNLSFSRGDKEEAVQENFRRMAEALGTKPERFVLSDQTHTVNIRLVTEKDAGKGVVKERDYRDVDGLLTDTPGLMLATFYADCVPLFFVDPVKKAIGLSHSGWKGTVNRMGKHTVEEMRRVFGTKPKDLICAVGPSICQECYEVSKEVADQFAEEFKGHEKEVLTAGKKPGKYQLDLWKANEIVLQEAGVKPENISVTGLCTCCNDKLLFSHRASQGKRGNLGAFLGIRKKAGI